MSPCTLSVTVWASLVRPVWVSHENQLDCEQRKMLWSLVQLFNQLYYQRLPFPIAPFTPALLDKGRYRYRSSYISVSVCEGRLGLFACIYVCVSVRACVCVYVDHMSLRIFSSMHSVFIRAFLCVVCSCGTSSMSTRDILYVCSERVSTVHLRARTALSCVCLRIWMPA